MKKSILCAIVACISFMNGGCSVELDFCSLLSVQEVSILDNDVVSSEMGVEYSDSIQTPMCFYKDIDGETVFSVTIADTLENHPYDIIDVLSYYMEGEPRVIKVDGVGIGAAALFDDSWEKDRFRLLMVSGEEWSASVRAKGVESEDSSRFEHVKDLAGTALDRFTERN